MDYIDTLILGGTLTAIFTAQYVIEKVSVRVKSKKRRSTWIPSN